MVSVFFIVFTYNIINLQQHRPVDDISVNLYYKYQQEIIFQVTKYTNIKDTMCTYKTVKQCDLLFSPQNKQQ